MKSCRLQARAALLSGFGLLSLCTTCLVPKNALAEVVVVKNDSWEVYTDGRVGGFLSYVHGENIPPNPADGALSGGGWTLTTEPQPNAGRGTVDMWRVRSGFLGNQLGLGVRAHVTPWTSVTGYIQMWAWIESDGRFKNQPNWVDARQGYAKVEGPYGAVTVGRTRTLFSRGATDINVLYAHKWGVGFPNVIDKRGPTLGMVGFGVMGSGFAAGMIYGTPAFQGLQLNLGIFDPAALQGANWPGTKYPRAEAELTFERKFGTTGKVVLFTNGAYQKVYQQGQCPAQPGQLCNDTAAGVGYGGRFELGPVRLGLAGHYGKGLGTNYALEDSYGAADAANRLRPSDGYYVQTQVVVNKFDFFAGWGIARVFLTQLDKDTPGLSVIKYQMGINGGVVYNLTPNVHLDLEYFRAYAKWYLGQSQELNCFASGMTFNW